MQYTELKTGTLKNKIEHTTTRLKGPDWLDCTVTHTIYLHVFNIKSWEGFSLEPLRKNKDFI